MSKPKLSEFLLTVKARHEKATKGPWDTTLEVNVEGKPRRSIWARHHPDQVPQDQRLAILPHPHAGWWIAATRVKEEDNGLNDAAFIAHARTDVEVLVKMVGLLNSRVDHEIACEVTCTGECDCGFVHLQKNLEALVPEEKS